MTEDVMIQDIQSRLSGLEFPADKQAIIGHAKHKNAPHDLITALNGISNREYLDAEDLMKEMGEK